MKRASIALLFVAALLATAPIVAVAQDAGNSTTGNSSELTLDELKQDGPRQGNAPDGVRMGEEKAYWAVYWPASNPFAEPGTTEGGTNLPPDHTVGRNEIYLRTWTFEDREHTVKVAYWERGTQTVTEGNTTREVPVAKNVSVATHEVTFERGRPTVEIPLRQHDERKQVTMWIEGEEYARWTFAHKSIATTQSADINSQGEYLATVITDFILWIVLGGFVVGAGVKKMLDRAHIGPQYGYAPWLIGLTVVTGIGTLILYQFVASLLVNAQYVLSIYVVGVFGVILLETYTTDVSKALFMRPTLTHAESPTGDDAFDVLDAEVETQRIVRSTDGTVSIVSKGLFPFLARVFGARAELENASELRTRVPVDGKYDELFLVDPEATEIIHYSPESWTVSLPELTRENVAEYGLVVAGLAVATGSLATGRITGTTPTLAVLSVTAAGLGVWALQPVNGIAAVNPAPIHLRTAFGNLVEYIEDVDDAKHLSEVKTQLDNERISKQRDVEDEVATHDRTLVESWYDPDEKVPASIEDGADNGNDLPDPRHSDGPLGNGEVTSDDD